MADPTTPTTPATPAISAETLNQTAAAQRNLTQAQSDSLGVMGTVNTALDAIDKVATDVGVSFNNLAALTDQQIEKFSLGAAAALQARDAFASFAGVDYSGVSTFGDQLKNIQDALGAGGTAATLAGQAIVDMADKILGSSTALNLINKAQKDGVDVSKTLLAAIKAEGKGMLDHADNINRARTAYVQMAGKTGELGDVISAAGPGMKDLNTIIERQKIAIEDTADATGLTVAQTERWYNQLGLVPGALKSVVDISEKGGKTMSMLTAAIQTAVGTGRSQEDVMRDLTTAFRDYGLVGEKALLFSVRMSDVSTRLKAPIDDVSSALRGSADAFKLFASGQDAASKSSEGLAETLNTYGKALESTGLSASASIEIVSQMTNQVSKLTLGQQAFISQQTGGGGGLRGAYQVEQRLQQGDTAGVVRDALKAVENQMGQLVSVGEAAQSEAAANQLTKQTALLQSLLGPLAKDRQSAEKLIQAQINQQKGLPGAMAEALKPTAVQDAAKRGLDLQKQTNSILTTVSHTLDKIRDLGDVGAGRILGRSTAGAGATGRTAAQGALSTDLSRAMESAQARSGSQTASFANQLSSGKVKETAGADFAASLHNTATAVKDVPLAIRATYDSLRGALSSGSQDTVANQQSMLNQFTASRRAEAEQLKNSPGAGLPSTQVGAAAIHSAVAAGAGAGIVPVGAVGAVGAPGAAAPGAPQTVQITGKFTIDCPHCGRPADVSDQAKIYPQQYNR